MVLMFLTFYVGTWEESDAQVCWSWRFSVVPQTQSVALKIYIPGALGSIPNPKKQAFSICFDSQDNILWTGLK